MPQTFYVTQDEEILSLVGRLRSSALLENVFVVPKRALILQSVVNLRILAREAEKLGKVVVIVTQDNDGRMLAEKAGIATRAYSEETRTPDRALQPVSSEASVEQPQRSLSPTHVHPVNIGSDDFFGGRTPKQQVENVVFDPPRPNPQEEIPIPSGQMKLRVRDTTPKNLTALNSKAVESPIGSQGIVAHKARVSGEDIRRSALEQSASLRVSQNTIATQPVSENGPSGRLARVYRNREEGTRSHARETGKPLHEKPAHVGSKARFWFFLFIVVSTLSLLGTGAFLFLPRAEIIAVPNSSSQSVEMEFEGKTSDISGGREIPVRLVEKEMEVAVSIDASGDASGNGEKAHGKIVISNTYDGEPQPLVATTRFESSDGKIFRLVRGVTVPGVSEVSGKNEPGVVEAEVVADEAGESYNIDSSTFTIPGFKGSPKYDKFLAKSTGKMTGGSSVGDSKNRTVSSADIARAKEESKKKFISAFEEAVRAEGSQDDRFLAASADVTLVGAPSAPQAGIAAPSFEYVAKWKGKVFVFSESALREKATTLLKSSAGKENGMTVRDMSFEFGDATPDYEKGLLYIRARVTTLFVSQIDTESLKSDFLGKGTEEIKEALGRHSEIKKIEINLKPKFFSFSVPKDRSRVTVRVEEP